MKSIIEKEKKKLGILRMEQKSLEIKISNSCKKLRKLEKELILEKFNRIKTDAGKANFIMNNEFSKSIHSRETINNLSREFFGIIELTYLPENKKNYAELYVDGFYYEINKPAFSICIHPDCSDHKLKLLVKKINLIKKHITKDCPISLFEKDLSENGVYKLTFNKNSCKLYRVYYHITKTIYEGKSLLSTLKYIRKNHYYR